MINKIEDKAIESYYLLLEHNKQTEIRAIDLFGFIGQKVSNPEIFRSVEEIIKKGSLIAYDGSQKDYKKYHVTLEKPDMSSKLLPIKSYPEQKEAIITGLSVFSDKIVCILDNKKHIAIAEGNTVTDILNQHRADFELLIGKKVYFAEPEFIITKADRTKIQNYFVSTKKDFISICQRLNSTYNLYAGLNERTDKGTEAKDVISVKIIFVDIDCTKKPASEEDLKEAKRVTYDIVSVIEKQTGLRPSIVFSGNGFQLFYRIPEITINDVNREEIEDKIQQFQKELIKKYSTDRVKLDNVGDLPRIARITGTLNLKGQKVSEFVEYHAEENTKLKDYILSLKPETTTLKVGELETSLREFLDKDERVKKLFEGDTGKFPSRSEAEQSLVCHLIGLDLNKEQIFKVMASCRIGKWQEANIHYRDLTYKKALEIINSKKRKAISDLAKPETKYVAEPPKEILDKFKDKDLMQNIKKELDKDHLEDDNLKQTAFITSVSGLLKNPRQRSSLAIMGDPSVGKDNAIKTVLKHLPDGTWIFLTNATQSALEDDVKDKRIIAYSEVNKFREEGANKHLTEAIKQMTEGGMSSLKKDLRQNLKTSRFEIDEQKCVLYGTTEEQRDVELETRFLCGTMQYTYNRGKLVSENTLDLLSDVKKLLAVTHKEDSWIKQGIDYFYNGLKQFDFVLIPYADLLKEYTTSEGKQEAIFNYNDPRSQRDVKRIFNLTSAVTWLRQLQRKSINVNGKYILISEPEDFIYVLKVSLEFFNEAYTGIDARLDEILEAMSKYANSELSKDADKWIPRDYIEKETGKAKNTIKARMNILADNGIVEGIKGRELNLLISSNSDVKPYDSNKIYYKRCHKGFKKVLIRCQISDIIKKLENFTPKFDTLTDTLFCEEKLEK
jgi:hypothetical protein